MAACLVAGAQRSEARSVTLADLGTEVGLSDATISPDGKQVALVTSVADYESNRFVRSLRIVDSGTGVQRELVARPFAASSPQWSPTGDRLAWLDQAGTGKLQIHVMSMNGTGSSAPVVVTDASEGVQFYEWSPDGRAFAFITADRTQERTGVERHNRSFEVGNSDYLAMRAAVSSHIWIVPVTGGVPRRLTSGVESVGRIKWLRDGQAIAFISQPTPHFADLLKSSLKVIDTGSGQVRVLVPFSPDSGALWQSPLGISPEGDLISFQASLGPGGFFRGRTFRMVPVAGGKSRDIAPDLDRTLRDLLWLADRGSHVFMGEDGTRNVLWHRPLDGPSRRLELGDITGLQIWNLSVSTAGTIAFVGSEAQRPAELYLLSSVDAKPRRLTQFNESLAALSLGRMETIDWRNDDFALTGTLIYPPGFKKNQKAPLVIRPHGGPAGLSTQSFDGFSQLLAAQGWLVFSPNFRGSTSGDDAFTQAVVNDYGDGPARDVMAGLKVLKARGIVDTTRIAVSGWSYGGFLTNWLTSHYTPWCAAVSGAALTDHLDSYNLADINVGFGDAMGGSPWRNDNATNYWRQSVMAQAHRIQTPTLILSTTGDRRVPVTQSYKLYHALKDNGVDVQFIAYPVDGHAPPDPVHQRDVSRRWVEWIAKHCGVPAH
ncbi:S9 family peptidase [Steroidobacter sp.]|uniref:S9 family peptidase n=1 Tax=Steroidobacter sp. TaxID=1978227 RepID=UPI001A4E37E5|nr:S9 family peptidase [Steroidobacter sp.]MBL8267287.1 S9 family peptidase [Steroidobacter sp.]